MMAKRHRARRRAKGAVVAVLGVGAFALSREAGAQERPWTEHGLAAPSSAFELKVGTGYTQGFGMIAPGQSLPDTAGAGLGVSADVDYRFDPHGSFGVQAEYQQFNPSLNTNARGFAANLGVTLHGRPYSHGDPWLRLATGYRLLWSINPFDEPGVGQTMLHGFEVAKATIGYDLRFSEGVAVAPVVGADLDIFAGRYQDGTSVALSSAQVGMFVFAGLQARFDAGGSRVPYATVATSR